MPHWSGGRKMETIRIKYFSEEIERLKYIGGKSDWIDLRASERVELKKGDSYCGDQDMWRMPVYATRDTVIGKNERICQFRIVENQPEVLFEECKSLQNEDRGGFGSTGKV